MCIHAGRRRNWSLVTRQPRRGNTWLEMFFTTYCVELDVMVVHFFPRVSMPDLTYEFKVSRPVERTFEPLVSVLRSLMKRMELLLVL